MRRHEMPSDPCHTEMRPNISVAHEEGTSKPSPLTRSTGTVQGTVQNTECAPLTLLLLPGQTMPRKSEKSSSTKNTVQKNDWSAMTSAVDCGTRGTTACTRNARGLVLCTGPVLYLYAMYGTVWYNTVHHRRLTVSCGSMKDRTGPRNKFTQDNDFVFPCSFVHKLM